MESNSLLEMADRQAWVDGDLVRVLVLYRKGGIWIDFDTILTGRDLRVLGEHEWVTQWDCYGNASFFSLLTLLFALLILMRSFQMSV